MIVCQNISDRFSPLDFLTVAHATGASKAEPFMGKGLHKIFNSFKQSGQKIKIKSQQSNLKHLVDIFSLSGELHQTKGCFISSWKPFEIQNELERSKRHEALFPEWSLFHWHLRILRLILDNYSVWGGASHMSVIRARVVQIKLLCKL